MIHPAALTDNFEKEGIIMKKMFFLLFVFLTVFVVLPITAAPETDAQIDLIAANSSLWKQDVEFGNWGYTVTDLDHNGRLEIISASVQGTGFYTYILAYEVSADGTGLTELIGPEFKTGNSAPDIMVSEVPVFYDKKDGRYYYIFDDMIRNGMAEYYENKRAVSIFDGAWTETYMAYKTTLYTDAEHYSMDCRDANNNTITESQYNSIAETVYANLEQGKAEFNWIITDNDEFSTLSTAQIAEKLR